MGAILLEIINNRVIQAAALAWAIAQGIKVLLTLAISRRFDYTRVFGSGGMPSSHSSMACAMLMVVGLHEGFSSAVFALAFCFAGVTMYDAAGVRRSMAEMPRSSTTSSRVCRARASILTTSISRSWSATRPFRCWPARCWASLSAF